MKILWICFFAVLLGIGYYFNVYDLDWWLNEGKLPKCDSDSSRKLIKKTLEKNPSSRSENLQLVEIKDIKELGYNDEKQIRSCAMSMITTYGQFPTNFFLEWGDNRDSVKISIKMPKEW